MFCLSGALKRGTAGVECGKLAAVRWPFASLLVFDLTQCSNHRPLPASKQAGRMSESKLLALQSALRAQEA